MQAEVAQTIRLGDATLHYRVTGADGPPVVMLHGAGGVLMNGRVAERLATGFQVYEPSLPGCDGTQMDGVTTLFSQTDLISEFVQTVIGGSAHVVAQSYGARVGVWLAIRHPAVVRRLVLSAPAVLEGSRSAPPPAPGQPDAPPPALFGSQPPPFTAEQLRHIEAGARNMFSVMPTSPDRATTLQRLQEISAPTLLLWAGAEQVLDPASGPDTYAEAIPGLRVQVIERAPRLLTVMATDEYVAHTTEFLLAD